MKLSAGEALAAAGLVIAGVSMVDQTGPGFGTVLAAGPADAGVRAHLTRAELASCATIAIAGVVAAYLTRAAWPIVVALVAVAVTVGLHETALRADGGG